MIRYGRNVRWLNDYKTEIEFSKKAGFDFHQVWYDYRGISINDLPEPKEQCLKDTGFPCIIHALLDIAEFEEHIYRLCEISKVINSPDIIIHPVCKREVIREKTVSILSEKVGYAYEILSKNGIKLFIENNSKIDPINYKVPDIKQVFDENPEVEFLLDIAHIDSYEHLEDMISVKMPKKLHVADKRSHIPHEHLPVGKGNIDFKYVFSNVLKNFDGDVIFEIVDEDEAILQSKRAIQKIIKDNALNEHIKIIESALDELTKYQKVENTRCDRCNELIEVEQLGYTSFIVRCKCGFHNDTLRGL